jgi:endoglucanase
VQPNPGNRVPYGPQDAHFALALVSLAGADSGGVVFQASNAREAYKSELGFSKGRPQASWIDSEGRKVELTSAAALAPDTPAVVSFTCAPGAQTLRVDSTVAARAKATLSPAAYDQFLIGWGFLNYYPRESFQGHVYAVITGKGAPSAEELRVLELSLKKVA